MHVNQCWPNLFLSNSWGLKCLRLDWSLPAWGAWIRVVTITCIIGGLTDKHDKADLPGIQLNNMNEQYAVEIPYFAQGAPGRATAYQSPTPPHFHNAPGRPGWERRQWGERVHVPCLESWDCVTSFPGCSQCHKSSQPASFAQHFRPCYTIFKGVTMRNNTGGWSF